MGAAAAKMHSAYSKAKTSFMVSYRSYGTAILEDGSSSVSYSTLKPVLSAWCGVLRTSPVDAVYLETPAPSVEASLVDGVVNRWHGLQCYLWL